ncbi:PAS domain-containing sensor histidine kinase [Hoeflea sp. WL0058]|uniref:histidine kinase n=1 Tax=Flavimaribacter sediminis TaxID=2865987 RepID=A0AAE2ZLM4_9HYPH|nr:PAS domain-containing sensor histidine kinase [Flavimaribacter sediminis]MBW8636945.1 PAS domain-containing sensor histidine kinase [Flavimaribacter sediminis]
MTAGEYYAAAKSGLSTELSDRRRPLALLGIVIVGCALASAIVSFIILMGLTPIEPRGEVVLAAVVVNLVFVVALIALILREVNHIVVSRKRGRAASRLHVRIIGLFSVVAILPAILVAIVASITLDVGLDRWFSLRTKEIVNSSLSVAQAYVNENARYLQGQTVSMASTLDGARTLYSLDRTGFNVLVTRQAIGRGLLQASLVRRDGSIVVSADIETSKPLPDVPQTAIDLAANGEPALIPPGATNLVGAVIQLQNIPDMFLYTIRAVDPEVMESMRLMEDNTAEYHALETDRAPIQLAFAILYLGFALIVLLAAIWTAIAVADRIVRPIRQLIGAADNVANGNLDVRVPVRRSDGDVGSLSNTFNTMTDELRAQRDEIIAARDEMDERRRFTEAVLSGVTAGVISVQKDGLISIANRSAEIMFDAEPGELEGRRLEDVSPEIANVLTNAAKWHRSEYRSQVSLIRNGKESTVNVQVTQEGPQQGVESYVVTLDDITDLVLAQRSTAWADVARRIAHEIKNPLTPIQLSAERIKRRYGRQISDDDREVFDQCTDTIVRQVEDIGRMVDEFSSFARMPKPTKEKHDLREILKDSIFLREVSRNDIEFIRELGDDPIMGYFDSRMLSQAFGNIIKNAAEAIDAVPSSEPRDGRRIKISAKASKVGGVVVDVIDNGKGLPVENRNRIFEPYMTMREKGTGLGLAIVKKIIDEHEGVLELHDAPKDFDPNGGAMIRVRFPFDSSVEKADLTGEKETDGV